MYEPTGGIATGVAVGGRTGAGMDVEVAVGGGAGASPPPADGVVVAVGVACSAEPDAGWVMAWKVCATIVWAAPSDESDCSQAASSRLQERMRHRARFRDLRRIVVFLSLFGWVFIREGSLDGREDTLFTIHLGEYRVNRIVVHSWH
jgi:hypothetical protein